jgi:hypothetical protein
LAVLVTAKCTKGYEKIIVDMNFQILSLKVFVPYKCPFLLILEKINFQEHREMIQSQ